MSASVFTPVHSVGIRVKFFVFVCVIIPFPPDSVGTGIMFSGCPSASSVCSFVHLTDLVTRILMNGLSNLKLYSLYFYLMT